MASEMNVLLEKATSPYLLEVDITLTLQIVDLIRQNDVSVKVAVQSIFNKLKDPNPNVILMTLQVLDFVVKNCGEQVHEEVCSRTYCEAMEELIQGTNNEEVRSSACQLLGSWCAVFKGQSKLQPVQDLVNILRAKGRDIPTCSEAAALYSADAAPQWAEGSCCHRCRSAFGLLKRKHHCRACGQVFCHECSSRNSNIPKFGIEKEVRVCESCYHEINNPTATVAKTRTTEESTATPSKTKSAGGKGGKTAEELQEEEELQLALALSKSEAENKEKEKLRLTNDLLGGGSKSHHTPKVSNVSAPPHSPSPAPVENEDPELSRYLNRQYWEEQKAGGTTTTMRTTREEEVVEAQPPIYSTIAKTNQALQGSNDEELNEFTSTFKTQLEIFVNRMKSNQSRGRPIANDSSVQSLFVNLTAMHSQLLQHLQQQNSKRIWYEQLQDKLSQAKDARAALEALREEHRERERKEREEQQRIRQMQMMVKLEVMRKKKQEYLEYQRQMAVHKMAQTERQILQQPYYGGPPPPQGYMPPFSGDPRAPYMPQQWPTHGAPEAHGGYPQHPGMGIPNPGMGLPHHGSYQPPVSMPHQPPVSMPHQPPVSMPHQPGAMPHHLMSMPRPGVMGHPGGMPQQPGGMPQQPGGMPQQPGGMPQQPGGMPQQPGGMPQQPGGMPQQPGGMPQQPGGMPQQPGGMPQQPGGMPQQPGGMPQQPGGMPQQPGGMPQQPGGMPQQPGGMPQQPGGMPQQPGGMPQQPGGVPQSGTMPQQQVSMPQQPLVQSPPEQQAELISFD